MAMVLISSELPPGRFADFLVGGAPPISWSGGRRSVCRRKVSFELARRRTKHRFAVVASIRDGIAGGAVAAARSRPVRARVSTLVEVESDEAAVEEAAALAWAAARAARDAARDAAAFAEARAAVAESASAAAPAFPTEQDWQLLERARLSERARVGAGPEAAEVAGAPPKMREKGEFSSAGLDRDSGGGREREDGAAASGIARGGVTVWSNRKKERMMKRERATTRGESAASPSGGFPRARKPLLAHDPSDPIRAYLRDVGKSKLLTAAEEVGLAEGIQDLLKMEGVKADLMEQMGREPSALEWAKAVGAEHQSLESRIKTGQACKDKMVNSNLRLVVSIAKRYQNRGMTIQDLIQEGSMGLIRGAEKFDHRRGFKFSTYAHWWIRQAITRAIADQSRTIRLPVHVFELLSRITKAKSMLTAEHGRVPRDEEVAELVGLNPDKLKLVIKAAKLPKSMDYPVGKNEDTMLGELIPDKDVEAPEDAISRRLFKQDINKVLNTLNPRERDVLRLRYGLEDGRMHTLEEIGNVFSVTRERIRQIESKALRKLRQPSRNSVLREYLEHKR